MSNKIKTTALSAAVTLALGLSFVANAQTASEVVNSLKNKAVNATESLLSGSLNDFANQFGEGNTEISVYDVEGGDAEYSIVTVQPLSQTEDKSETVFFQGSVYSFKNHGQKRPTLNLGVGKRWLSEDKSEITGINLFYDFESKSKHSRASLGAEYKRSAFEANANAYWGVSSKKSVTINGVAENEEVLDGYDVNVKGQVPYLPWAKVTGTHYKWKRDTKDDIEGGTVGIELKLNSATTLEAGFQDDNAMDKSDFVKLTYK
ncbi:inverse autotransporter beta domain-containing protein, partial [Candidatus Thioglobus sp.]|uniref:inverse autotransporter beta domain-containing protein n=1 Tax=Candidatus Thioglobus sp. TaxID=2026721 RepID=UPI002605A171